MKHPPRSDDGARGIFLFHPVCITWLLHGSTHFVAYLLYFNTPAKGVGWGNWREGSNPSFSATKSIREDAFEYK